MADQQGQVLGPFPCNKCGACCKRVGIAPETSFLDRGDGACMHFDPVANLCAIYESRPDVCRVDKYFVMHYQSVITWDRFVEANLDVCRQLESLDAELAEQVAVQ